MYIIIESFAQFMPAIFFMHLIGVIWEFIIDAWRGRWS